MDGVLVHSGRRFSATLAEVHGISLETTSPFFTGAFQDCLTGHADLKDAISPYLEDWGWGKGVDALLDYWFKLENELNQELIEYIHELRGKSKKCFLATNNEKYRFEFMMQKMGLNDIFDKTYASAHLGSKKPEQEFFSKIFTELHGTQKDEILFVDDSTENIEGAKEFGIHTELYTSLDGLKEKVALLDAK